MCRQAYHEKASCSCYTIHLYNRTCRRYRGLQPRCVLIEAALGYFTAKLIIKLINNVAAVINNDGRARPGCG